MVSLLAVAATAVGVVLLVAGGATLWGAQRLYMRDTDSGVDVTNGGRVALEGIARRHEKTCHAPFSGHPCLGYAWAVQSYSSSGGGIADGGSEGGWSNRKWGDELAEFRLDTDDASVLVRSDRVTLDLSAGDYEHATVVDSRADAPTAIESFADERGIDLESGYRFVERYLDMEETAYVVGISRPASPSTQLPRDIDAAVGPPPVDGLRHRLSQRLWPFSFRVADTDVETALRQPWIQGLLGIIVGLVALGYAVFLSL